MQNKTYSFLKGLSKALISFIVFAIPFFLTQFPDIANLTLGAVSMMVVNYLKLKWEISEPNR